MILYEAENETNDVDEDGGDGHLGDHILYSRAHWGARSPIDTDPLVHPTNFVIISHSVSPTCDSFRSCSNLVRGFQEWHFSEGFYDIGYNFVIGGDGDIYEGRGWDVRNFHHWPSIGICFIGSFNKDELNDRMISAAKLLIEQAFNTSKISTDYILVGQNQTDPRLPLSPGNNVYRIIKLWPHFSNRTFFT